MSFKIVETIEKGKYVLTIVPEAWETLGQLRWPKKAEKLRQDPLSLPGDDWRSIPCVVKRSNIKSFEEAEIELSAMSDMSDTDQEIFSQSVPSKSKMRKIDFNDFARRSIVTAQIHTPNSATFRSSKSATDGKENIPINSGLSRSSKAVADGKETISFNSAPSKFPKSRPGGNVLIPFYDDSISEFLIMPSVNNPVNPEELEPVQAQVYEHSQSAPEIDNRDSQIVMTDTGEKRGSKEQQQQESMPTKDSLMETIKDISTRLTALETTVANYTTTNNDNLVILSENQGQILEKLSDISTQFVEFIKRSSTSNLTQTEDSNKGIKKIRNEKSLIEFEDMLKNKEYELDMMKVYSIVCGEGKGRAINNAYALSDAMFDRQFLKQCSWAGGSRGETSKICFKTYKRTIEFFFKIIHKSDKQFTVLECESFFKNILRNAKKRCESKQLKRSAQKKRQTKKKIANDETKDPNVTLNEKQLPVLANDDETNEPNVTVNENRGSVNEKNSENSPKEIEIAHQEGNEEDEN